MCTLFYFSRYLDFINVMTYDFHTSKVAHHSPLYKGTHETGQGAQFNTVSVRLNTSLHFDAIFSRSLNKLFLFFSDRTLPWSTGGIREPLQTNWTWVWRPTDERSTCPLHSVRWEPRPTGPRPQALTLERLASGPTMRYSWRSRISKQEIKQFLWMRCIQPTLIWSS